MPHGEQKEELEACAQLQGCDLTSNTDCWDGSNNWSAVMDGYRLFKKDVLGKGGRGVYHYVWENWECKDLYLGTGKEPDEQLPNC